ncbi:MAG: ABC transporter substrate-binding protein [Candidatus Acetothermia bacterium]|jgi:iron complex transport system substrate-binding protein|nr:ABC transporter substrate-binding protein [Candidatus Acetothermia bacterium]
MRYVKLLVLLVAVGVVGWAEGITQVDQAGRTVTVPTPVARVVSAYGIATWYVYALGKADVLIGARYVGQLPDDPRSRAVLGCLDPDLEAKILIGEPTVEEVVARAPDLVLAGAAKHRQLAELLAELGVPCLLYAPETFAGVREATVLTGRALGVGEKAAALVAFYDQILFSVAAAIADIPEAARPRACFLGTERLRVASGDMYQARLIELAGGIPVSRDLRGSWQNVNLEQMLLWNPEVIFIPSYGNVRREDILGDPDWQAIAAVKAGRVWKLPRLVAPWDVPVPESALGLLWMADLLHPGRVGLDVVAEVSRFYAEFYGCNLTPEEWAAFLGR